MTWPSMIRLLSLLPTVALLVFSHYSGAATVPEFSIAVSPELPLAGDIITVTVTPDNFAASAADFAWFQNNVPQPASSGTGRSSFNFGTDPSRAETIVVRVTLRPEGDFETASESTSITTIVNPLAQLRAAASSFELRATPKNPNPGETVTVAVQTFTFDKQRSTFEWSLNGAAQRDASGAGRHSLTLTAPSEGAEVTVTAVVTTPAGEPQSRSVTIRATSVPLYWWADTATPYWYRGKALPTVGSRVTFLALTSHPEADTFSYAWELNNDVVGRASGLQRNTFTVPLAFNVQEHIAVTLRNEDGGFSKSITASLRPSVPEVGIYELKPLRGIVTERVTNFRAPSGDEYDFIAMPFFFRGRNDDLGYRWSLNGRELTGTFTKPFRFRLRSNAGEATANEITVNVSDPIRSGSEAMSRTQADFY